VNVVLGWWWLNSLSEVRPPPTGAGPIAGGGVSTAVRLQYSAKQIRVLFCDLLSEVENAGEQSRLPSANFRRIGTV
jgi:hypothetical protein